MSVCICGGLLLALLSVCAGGCIQTRQGVSKPEMTEDVLGARMRSCSGEATKDGQRTTDNGNEQGTTGSRQRTTKERSTEQRLCVPVCLFVYTGGREKGQAGWLSGTLAKLPAAQGRTPDDADTHITAIGDEIDVCTREALETVCVCGARGQQYAAVRVGGGRGRGGRRRHSLPQTDGETDRDRCGGPLQDNPGRRLEGDWPGLRRRRTPAPALLLLLPPLPSRCRPAAVAVPAVCSPIEREGPPPLKAHARGHRHDDLKRQRCVLVQRCAASRTRAETAVRKTGRGGRKQTVCRPVGRLAQRSGLQTGGAVRVAALDAAAAGH